MVISISSKSTFEFEPVSLMIVIEDTNGYVPPQEEVPLVVKQTTPVVAYTAQPVQ